MRRIGWIREPWRHGLAARGVKTKYYSSKNRYFQEAVQVQAQQPSTRDKIERTIERAVKNQERKDVETAKQRAGPQAQLERAKAEEKLKAFQESQLRRKMPVEQAYEAIKRGELRVVDERGQPVSVATFASNPALSPQERTRLQSAINEQAILLAQAEQPVPAEYQGVLTNTTKAQLKAIAEQQKIAGRGAFKQGLIDTGKGAVIGAEELAQAGGQKVLQAPGQLANSAEEGLQGAKPGSLFPATPASKSTGQTQGTGGSPFFTDNPLLGGPNIATDGGNPFFSDSSSQKVDPYPEAKVAQKEVDEFFGARNKLKEVDLASFRAGKRAFEKGDRESLIRSINSLEAEEQKLRDRWTMVEQTRSVLLNPKTRAATLRKESSGFGGGLFGNSYGGSAIADQTQKLNETKREIKDSANEVFARRVSLQNDLRRMDAQVKPVTDAPKEVKIFKEDERESTVMQVFKPDVAWGRKS